MTCARRRSVGLLRCLARVAVAATLAAPAAAMAHSVASQPLGQRAAAARAVPAQPPIRHVLVVLLENKNYDVTFGPHSPAPYLANTLTSMGKTLTNYYGIGHNSLTNYIALISGQAPNPLTQADCPTFAPWIGVGPSSPGGQAIGAGCVYPASVETIAGQLEAKGLRWAGYMEDMGLDPSRDHGTTCAHPPIGALTPDPTQKAAPNDQYATRHNPFVYFQSILDNSASCNANDVPLTRLPGDLAHPESAPAYALIVPNLCNDAHDEHCAGPNVAGGHEGGLVAADLWLRKWIPQILGSATYQGGDTAVIVTFDEAEFPEDSSACCGEVPGPSSPLPGITGPGGGRIGAVVLSPCVTPGAKSAVAYNHYGLLRTVHDLFGLEPLGMASEAKPFGADVFDRSCKSGPSPPSTTTPTTAAAAPPPAKPVTPGGSSGGRLAYTGGAERWLLAGAAALVAAAALAAVARRSARRRSGRS